MVLTNNQRAEILTHALPYIKEYNGKIVVIKYGGSAMTDPALEESVIRDIVLLSYIGIKVVLVHGGGPAISKMLEKIGKTPEFRDGLRVTDSETMEIAQMVLTGKINKNLVKLLNKGGEKAIGLSGIDGGMLKAKQRDEKLGFVGDIVEINEKIILDVLEQGYIPVISTIGYDDEGNSYNINADTAAAGIAGKLKAECFISMTDIEGLLLDKDDPESLINHLNVSDIPALEKQGIIKGGMLPKVHCCAEAIRRGVRKVFIIDGRTPHSLIMEILTDEGVGTMFV